MSTENENDVKLRDAKAAAYDCLVQVEVWQSQLKAANERVLALAKAAHEDKHKASRSE